VRNFLDNFAPKYPNVAVKYTHGDPVAIFFNGKQEEVERVALSHLTEDDIHQVLQSRGFHPEQN